MGQSCNTHGANHDMGVDQYSLIQEWPSSPNKFSVRSPTCGYGPEPLDAVDGCQMSLGIGDGPISSITPFSIKHFLVRSLQRPTLQSVQPVDMDSDSSQTSADRLFTKENLNRNVDESTICISRECTKEPQQANSEFRSGCTLERLENQSHKSPPRTSTAHVRSVGFQTSRWSNEDGPAAVPLCYPVTVPGAAIP